jgi:uncharacterized protein involved in tolerance to divalent cations
MEKYIYVDKSEFLNDSSVEEYMKEIIYGYWEIFYWEGNNPEADEFEQMVKTAKRKNKIKEFIYSE